MERFRLATPDGQKSPQVVQRLKQKRDLLEANDAAHEDIKTALIIEGGGMRGAYAGGVVTALYETGFGETFDDVYTVSSGAPAGAYFLSGQPQLGTSMYYDQLTTRDFINPFRFWKILDVEYAGNLFRSGETRLDQEAVKASRSELHIGLTERDTGRCVWKNAREQQDITKTIEASCALPVTYNRTVSVDDEEYVDGVIGCSFPIERAIERGATDILVVFNLPEITTRQEPSLVSRLLTRFALHDFPPVLYDQAVKRNQTHEKIARQADVFLAENPSLSMGILAPDTMPLTKYTIKRDKLKAVAKTAEEQTRALFG